MRKLIVRTVGGENLEFNVENKDNQVLVYNESTQKMHSVAANDIPFDPGSSGLVSTTLGAALIEIKALIDAL